MLTCSSIQFVYLKDIGSMHGTSVQDRSLNKNIDHILKNGEIITFGIEVTRGQGTFTYHVLPLPGGLFLPASVHLPISHVLPREYGVLRERFSDPMNLLETFPAREFRVHYEWQEWT